MANVDTELILRRTLEHFKKTDPDIHGVSSASRYRESANSTKVAKKPVKLAVTDKVDFVSKKPNLHLMEDDSKESTVYNFHFPSDAEGSKSFDRILHVLQCVTSGAAHTLGPNVTPNVTAPARMIKIDDLFSVMGSPLTAGAQRSTASTGHQANANAALAAGQQTASVPEAALCDNGLLDEIKTRNDPERAKTETSSPLTASKLLARLNPRAQVSQMAPDPEAAAGPGPVNLEPGLTRQQMRNVPPPPPPDAEKPAAPPDIIAQLFGGTSVDASVTAPKLVQDDAPPSANRHAGHDHAVAVIASDQDPGSDRDTAADLSVNVRRASVKKMFQILLDDDRFLDAVADAMTTMAAGHG